MEPTEHLNTVVLGALLHEVSRFLVRVGAPSHDPSLCDAALDVAALSQCDDCRGKYSQDHAVAGALLVSELFASQSTLQDVLLLHHAAEAAIGDAAAVGRTIVAADRMASAQPSRGVTSETGDPAGRPLHSVFARIGASHVVPPFAPGMLTRPGDVTNPAETRHWPDPPMLNAFKADLNRAASATTPSGVAESVATVLDKWLWAVPSDAPAELHSDVSLAAHARLVAAFAAAIWSHPRRDDLLETTLGTATATDAPRLALIAGDVSGIQRFIYGTTTSHAARSLRARSMYVQLLADIASRRVAHELGLHPLSVVMASGGRFYVLGPDDRLGLLPQVSGKLLAATRASHGFDLQIVLGGAAFPVPHSADQQVSRMDLVFARANEAVSAAKRHRLAGADPDTLTALLAPRRSTGTVPPCGACGDEADFNPEAEASERRCRLCHHLEEFGRQLLTSDRRSLALADPSSATSGLNQTLGALGAAVTVGSGTPGDRLVTLNSTEQPAGRHAGWRFAWSTAGRGGRLLDFAEIAALSRGRPMLGVLRCDVDGLGHAFGTRLGEHSSISRISTLSWLLDTFFAGRIGEIVESQPTLYPVYGGGDDACVVGSWDALIEFALQVNREFEAFTGAALTMSAGIAFGGAHEPFYRLADAAGEAEEQAKRFEREDRAKNAISVLGHPWDWDELSQVWADAQAVAGLVTGGVVPRSFLQSMQSWYATTLSIQARRSRTRTADTGEVLSERAWIGRYQLARLRDRSAKSARSEIDRLLDTTETRLMRARGQLQLAAIARLAEWLTRKEDRR